VWSSCRILSRKLSKKGTKHAAWRDGIIPCNGMGTPLPVSQEDSAEQWFSVAKEGIVWRRIIAIISERLLSPDDGEKGGFCEQPQKMPTISDHNQVISPCIIASYFVTFECQNCVRFCIIFSHLCIVSFIVLLYRILLFRECEILDNIQVRSVISSFFVVIDLVISADELKGRIVYALGHGQAPLWLSLSGYFTSLWHQRFVEWFGIL